MNTKSNMVLFVGVMLCLANCSITGSGKHRAAEKERYRGPVLLVRQTESEIIAQNISGEPVAIRVSWDEQDPHGLGHCPDSPEDCFIDNWVEADDGVTAKFKNHLSVQIWVWGRSGSLVDATNLSV